MDTANRSRSGKWVQQIQPGMYDLTGLQPGTWLRIPPASGLVSTAVVPIDDTL